MGLTDLCISPVALGCWPISGMTSLGVNDEDSLRTLDASFELGINHVDTAYCYGAGGESERLIAKSLAGRRDQVVIATKCGIHWSAIGERIVDGRPDTLRRECEESLRRLGTDRVELLYLHAPDPHTPVSESASALRRLVEEGKTRSVGVSNFTLDQMRDFHQVCPITAIQPPYNMLQRDIETEIVPWCLQHQVSILVYWPLMKGLLTGSLRRDHQFDPRDGRPKYPMFQGTEWEKNQDLVDRLREIAARSGKSVTQIVVNWTVHQPGITAALCGAKRPDQIAGSAGGMGWRLDEQEFAAIARALAERGPPVTRWAI